MGVIQQALTLLAKNDYHTFLNVEAFVPTIIMADLNNGSAASSGLAGVQFDRKTFYEVCKGYTSQEVTALYAALLAHEAAHIQLHSIGLHDVVSENDREAICYLVELRIARKVGAPRQQITFMQQQVKKYINP